MSELQESEGESMEISSTSTSSAVKDPPLPVGQAPAIAIGMKRSASDGIMEPKRQRAQAQVADPYWALEKQHVDSIINFLIRLG